MRKLLNTLYVTMPEAYLSLDGENVVVLLDKQEKARIPLHNLEGIVTFGYTGASPALMGACAKKDIALTFLSGSGHFLARVSGENRGNVVLRRQQYRVADNQDISLGIVKNMVIGKICNGRNVLLRALRDHANRVEVSALEAVLEQMKCAMEQVNQAKSIDEVRGYEGEAAARYFSVFDELILQQKDAFFFHGRNKRPPLDNVNALLSFIYTLLAHEVAAALEAVGLDPYVGFLHTDRPGRMSLALDMMEELRAALADRFVLTLINKKVVNEKGFEKQKNGAVYMTDQARREILRNWQEKKQEEIRHPFLDEKVEWGLVPYVQAMLLARFLRNDLDGYPPFIWK